ncbi:MAG: hypothetical protein M5U34_10530 [Chloroflexi bacterium]|nr:hypothetical protein [Chloroflexota bacterium]
MDSGQWIVGSGQWTVDSERYSAIRNPQSAIRNPQSEINYDILDIGAFLLGSFISDGGMAGRHGFDGGVALPALRQGTLADNQWFALQRRFLPWAGASLVLLLFTGFVQMTNDPNYNGFLAVNSLWAWAILLKHIAFGGMVLIMAYVQFVLYPGMARLQLLGEKRPNL